MTKTKIKYRKLPFLLLALFLGYFFIKSINNSLFFNRRDRINFIIYGQQATFYSLGLEDKVNYLISFPADVKIKIPGGYRYYRVGALGKLVSLEKKPEIFRKAFSLATSSFLDYYFYPSNNSRIYFNDKDSAGGGNFSWQLFLSSPSNANFFDRLFLWIQMVSKKSQHFVIIKPDTNLIKGDRVFSEEDFAKTYLGYFYDKAYRIEKHNVQITYTKSYITAKAVSDLIEGNGIRVVDIAQKSENPGNCRVIEDKAGIFSRTAKNLAKFFDCNLEKGKTELSDIILILGKKEGEWEVN